MTTSGSEDGQGNKSSLATADELAVLERRIDGWLKAAQAANPLIAAVERSEDDAVRWFVRVFGEEKDVWTAWLTLGQRTLAFETYVLPAPERNQAQFYQHLLRRNHQLRGLAFEIGEEDAVFLAGSLPVSSVSEDAVDWILGSLWVAVELCFRPALRIGFISAPR
ncbi:MAG: YbjN domain-containing protein [Acidimicrobiia bacterium]|nr:YbjN domain-containing protein [Acidimicrobiia bacterium]MCY4457363.1 YbjN domain-containing protein [Acidimicrobiaceae bacterium]